MIIAIATVKRLFTIFVVVNISKGILFFKICTSLILSFKFKAVDTDLKLHAYLITAITKVP